MSLPNDLFIVPTDTISGKMWEKKTIITYVLHQLGMLKVNIGSAWHPPSEYRTYVQVFTVFLHADE